MKIRGPFTRIIRIVSREDGFTLAEAGVTDAVSILQNPSNDAQSTGLLCSDGAPLPCDLTHAKVATYDDGVVKYWGNYDTSSSTWTINSYGYMRNPTGPNVGKLIRRITTTVRVRPSFMQPPNSLAWNYIIATRTGTPGG